MNSAEIWKIIHGLASIHHKPGEAFLSGFWRSVGRDTASLTVKDTSLVRHHICYTKIESPSSIMLLESTSCLHVYMISVSAL